MMEGPAFMRAGMKRLGRLRSGLGTKADSAITAALNCLWEKEMERNGMQIQMDKSKSDRSPTGRQTEDQP